MPEVSRSIVQQFLVFIMYLETWTLEISGTCLWSSISQVQYYPTLFKRSSLSHCPQWIFCTHLVCLASREATAVDPQPAAAERSTSSGPVRAPRATDFLSKGEIMYLFVVPGCASNLFTMLKDWLAGWVIEWLNRLNVGQMLILLKRVDLARANCTLHMFPKYCGCNACRGHLQDYGVVKSDCVGWYELRSDVMIVSRLGGIPGVRSKTLQVKCNDLSPQLFPTWLLDNIFCVLLFRMLWGTRADGKWQWVFQQLARKWKTHEDTVKSYFCVFTPPCGSVNLPLNLSDLVPRATLLRFRVLMWDPY